MSFKIAGQHPSGAYLEQLKKSPQYNGKGFINVSPTPMMDENFSYWKLTQNFFKANKAATPPSSLPFVKTDLTLLGGELPAVVWFGHSSYFIRMAGKNILVDPVFSGYAAPLSFMIKAFPGADEYKPKDMPNIDVLVLTHDHYDHLDYNTILQLSGKVERVICSLGLSAHLQHWGMDASKITELDWWEGAQISDTLSLVATPARHFSGRGLVRGKTLWSSFVISSSTHRLFLGGDSGYDAHFKQIGEKFGPFDLAILEAGQYNTMWPLIHMMPEQTVQAAVDLGARVLLPVHWGKFKLAMHAWNEPVKRVVAQAARSGMAVTTPRIGEVVNVGGAYPVERWWESIGD